MNTQFLLFGIISFGTMITLVVMKHRKTSPGRIFQLWLGWIAIVYFGTSPYPMNITGFILLFIIPVFSYSAISYPEHVAFQNTDVEAFEDFPKWRPLIDFVNTNTFVYLFSMRHDIMRGAEMISLVFTDMKGTIIEVNRQKYLGKSEFSVFFKTFFRDGSTVSTTNLLSNQDVTFREKHPQYLMQIPSYNYLFKAHEYNVTKHHRGKEIITKKDEITSDLFRMEYNDKMRKVLSEGYWKAHNGRCTMTMRGKMRTLINYYNFLPLLQKVRIV